MWFLSSLLVKRIPFYLFLLNIPKIQSTRAKLRQYVVDIFNAASKNNTFFSHYLCIFNEPNTYYFRIFYCTLILALLIVSIESFEWAIGNLHAYVITIYNWTFFLHNFRFWVKWKDLVVLQKIVFIYFWFSENTFINWKLGGISTIYFFKNFIH